MKIETPTSTAAAVTTSGTGLKGSKDEFLKLFMAQLQHQDPFAPTSGADMVAQLAQLSSVEQAKQTNDQLADLAASQSAVANAGLSNLVGRSCSASLGAATLDGKGGAPPPIEIASSTPTKGAAIVVTDAQGKELRRIEIPDGSRTTIAAWDGKDSNGNPVKAGTYQIQVDSGQTGSSITALWSGRVDAVELTSEGPRLRMGSLLLMPADIRTIGTQHGPTGQES